MSILYYQPTGSIIETGRNVRHFMGENMPVFWAVLKPLMPYLAFFLLLDLLFIEYVMPPDPETGEKASASIFGIPSGYFFACLMISWHRVVIHGPDNYVAVNPLKPSKSELLFIGTIIGLTLGAVALIAGLVMIASIITPLLIPVALTISLIALVFLASRISFYFPSKATGGDLTLKQAYALSQGYVLRLLITPFFAMWKTVLLYFAYALVGIAIIYGLSFALGLAAREGILSVILLFLFGAPIQLYFEPLLAVIGVTVLSNYYQHALQNPRSSGASSADEQDKIASALNDIEPS